MILAVDVYYHNNNAFAGGVLFNDWGDCKPVDRLLAQISNIESYIPGEFYRRELPCILALLDQLSELPGYIVVDGYVYLGANRKPGLGKHLYDALQGRTPVIGVAKKRFKDTPSEVEIYRGSSQRPLYITSVGVPGRLARQHILAMCGEDRIPVLLGVVDQLCRQMALGSVG